MNKKSYVWLFSGIAGLILIIGGIIFLQSQSRAKAEAAAKAEAEKIIPLSMIENSRQEKNQLAAMSRLINKSVRNSNSRQQPKLITALQDVPENSGLYIVTAEYDGIGLLCIMDYTGRKYAEFIAGAPFTQQNFYRQNHQIYLSAAAGTENFSFNVSPILNLYRHQTPPTQDELATAHIDAVNYYLSDLGFSAKRYAQFIREAVMMPDNDEIFIIRSASESNIIPSEAVFDFTVPPGSGSVAPNPIYTDFLKLNDNEQSNLFWNAHPIGKISRVIAPQETLDIVDRNGKFLFSWSNMDVSFANIRFVNQGGKPVIMVDQSANGTPLGALIIDPEKLKK